MSSLIAVLNDNDAFLVLMRTILTDEGYRVIVRVEGKNRYEMVLREMPDLVILDIRLETPDAGMVILELLRLNPKTAAIPVIVCTSDVRFLRENRDALASKGYLMLEKPFDLDELLTKVRSALAGISWQENSSAVEGASDGAAEDENEGVGVGKPL